MPTFVTIEWKSAIPKNFNKAKSPEAILADLEMKVFDKAVDTLESNHKIWADYAAKSKEAGKQMLERAAAALIKIRDEPEANVDLLVKEIQGVQTRLGLILGQVKDANESYAKAFADDGFRVNSLKDTIKSAKVFEKVDEGEVDLLLKPVTAKREATINLDRGILAERKRLEEYDKRAAALLTAALTLASGAKLDKEKFLQEFNKIEKAFEGEQGIDRSIQRLDQKLEEAFKAGESGPRPLAEAKFKLGVTEFPSMRKGIAGNAKTAALQLRTLKSTYGKSLRFKLSIAKMEKRLIKAIEEIKMRGARVDGFEKKMTELMSNLAN